MTTLSVIGLGKLGAPLAAVLASKGFDVIGVDLNANSVRLLNEGRAPVEEPQLQALIDASRARLRATTSFEEAVLASEVSFIIVPTPSDESGAFSNRYVLAAIEQIGRALRKKDSYHVVNVTSTVMPGSTDGELREALERHSGRAVGHSLGLCYNPEFIALGSVVRDTLYPDMILIGESDPKAGTTMERIYKQTCERNPPIQRMNLINAELTKISVNTFVTTKISYANMLADLCDHLPGADVDVVTAALGKDSRIGSKYLKGALGYGGPCFPRDNRAFALLARRIEARADLAEATDRINSHQTDRLFSRVTEHVRPGGCVAILGLSYKPDTAVIEESQGVALARRAAAHGLRVSVYDPAATREALGELGALVEGAESMDECVRDADLVVIATPWPQFRELPLDALRRPGRRLPVLDCWRMLPAAKFAKDVQLIYLGRGASQPGTVPELGE